MNAKTRNIKAGKPLTHEQILLAAINSDHPTVKKAVEKLTFVVEMSHTRDELAELVDPWVRKIQAVFQNDGEYKRYMFKWCGDEFEIVNQKGQTVQAGDADTDGREPTLVYVLDKD